MQEDSIPKDSQVANSLQNKENSVQLAKMSPAPNFFLLLILVFLTYDSNKIVESFLFIFRPMDGFARKKNQR